MITSLIAVMLGASTTLPAYSLPPAKRVRCTGACASRYRIPAASDDTGAIKKRALANDGSKCDVIGAKRCTSKGHRFWRSDY